MWSGFQDVLGLGIHDPSLGQMATRAVAIYLATLVMVRVGARRFLGRNTAFDVVAGVILGSVMSRAINGDAPFFPTLGAGLVIVGLHWLFAYLTFRSHQIGRLIKGQPRVLVKDGKIQWDAMARSGTTEHDLLEALRSSGWTTTVDDVREAHLERSGSISVIPARRQPRVLDVAVREGVQTVRIQLE